MTAKDKAQELYDKFIPYVPVRKECEHKCAKKCALIAVDEIISAIGFSSNDEYWVEVKQEIEKL